jgi:hypothetical protein
VKTKSDVCRQEHIASTAMSPQTTAAVVGSQGTIDQVNGSLPHSSIPTGADRVQMIPNMPNAGQPPGVGYIQLRGVQTMTVVSDDPPHDNIAALDNTRMSTGQIDSREQLVNGREVGPIDAVSLPLSMITSLHGIMLDLDPCRFRAELTWPLPSADPIALYDNVIRPMLGHESVLRRAEVRVSGRGLHVRANASQTA